MKLEKKGNSNNWYVRVWLPKHKKYKWVATHTANKKEATKMLNQYQKAEIEYKLGLREDIIDKPSPTLRDAISQYMKSRKNSRDVGNSTLRSYKFSFADLNHVVRDNTLIDEINNLDIERLNTYFNTKPRGSGAYKGKIGLSDATINIRKRGLMAFMKWCLKMEYIKRIPNGLEQIKNPINASSEGTDNNRKKIITKDELKQVLKREKDPVLRAYYRTAFNTGLRRIEVNHSQYFKLKDKHYLRVTKTKGKKEPRIVPLRSSKTILDFHICKEAQYSVGRVTKGWTKVAKKCGFYIPYDKTLHANRHAFATYSAKDGKNMMALKESMGHKSLTTTEQYAKASYLFYVSEDNIEVNA